MGTPSKNDLQYVMTLPYIHTSRVEAIQLNRVNCKAVAQWCGGEATEPMFGHAGLKLPTLDGVVEAKSSDYILKDSLNRFHVMSPSEFRVYYDLTVEGLDKVDELKRDDELMEDPVFRHVEPYCMSSEGCGVSGVHLHGFECGDNCIDCAGTCHHACPLNKNQTDGESIE